MAPGGQGGLNQRRVQMMARGDQERPRAGPPAPRTSAESAAARSNPNCLWTCAALNAVALTTVPNRIRPLRCGKSIVRAKLPAPRTSSRPAGAAIRAATGAASGAAARTAGAGALGRNRRAVFQHDPDLGRARRHQIAVNLQRLLERGAPGGDHPQPQGPPFSSGAGRRRNYAARSTARIRPGNRPRPIRRPDRTGPARRSGCTGPRFPWRKTPASPSQPGRCPQSLAGPGPA